MSLLVLRFHRVGRRRDGNPVEMLDAHFAQVAREHVCVLPGELLDPERLNVCLTFDDAYFDFHRFVLPLLKKHRLRVLLGVPAGLCPDRTSYSAESRLELLDRHEFPYRPPASYCSWDELAELARSGCVEFAAHGLEHLPLDEARTELEREIEEPQRLLKERLGAEVSSFIFPYGRSTGPALRKVHEHYRYAFRLGEALNESWEAPLLYRMDADAMASPTALFAPERLRAARWRGRWLRLLRR